MSQSLVRKTQNGSESASKARVPLVKASGDSVPHRNQKQDHSSRGKNKIPKSIRYDLENALVGLCDVWFEDIKPHLVRNKIKLHVDANGATASGDFSRLPPAAPGCSHLDPGAASDRIQQTIANSAVCCSTQQTASKAQYRRPPALHLPPSHLHHPSSPPTLPDITSQNKTSKRKTRTRTRKQPPQLANWRVPRLCRTYSLLSPAATGIQTRRTHTASPLYNTRQESCLLSPVPRIKTKTRSKYTQTETTNNSNTKYRNSEKRPAAKPSNSNAVLLKNQNPIDRTSVVKAALKMEPLRDSSLENNSNIELNSLTSSKRTFSVKEQNSMTIISLRKSRAKRRQTKGPSVAGSPGNQRQRKQPCKEDIKAFPSVNQNHASQPNRRQFRRCYATTNLSSRTSNQECRQKYHKHQSQEIPSKLFDEDLIEIIGTKHDKRLRVLYKSPNRQEFPSLMNLVASPSDLQRASSHTKKILPWK